MAIQDKVIDIISEQTMFSAEKIKLTSSLYSDLAIDDVGLFEIIFALEEELDIKIPDDVMNDWQIVQDIVDFANNAEKKV